MLNFRIDANRTAASVADIRRHAGAAHSTAMVHLFVVNLNILLTDIVLFILAVKTANLL